MDEYHVSSGVTSTGVVVSNAMYVYGGGVANSTIVSGGDLYIEDGGLANRTTVDSFGDLRISNGGTANITTVNYYGGLRVESGGTANSTTVNSDGELLVESSGTVNGVTVNSGGSMWVESGGTAWGINWTPFVGEVTVEDGADVTFVGNCSGVYFGSGSVLLSSALTMKKDIGSGQSMYVMSGGTANSTTVNAYGAMYVVGGAASVTIIGSRGRMTVLSGGTANITTVNTHGELYVSSGGTATDIIASSGAFLELAVMPGTYAKGTYAGAAFEVKDAVLSGYTVRDGGVVVGSGTADSIIVSSSGYLTVSRGGTANGTTVDRYGELNVSSGGTADGTIINARGYMDVSSGGTAKNTTVSGGNLYVSSGGKVTGLLTVTSGATVSSYVGGIIDFDVSGIAPENMVLVNDFSRIKGAPSYTVTVSGSQAAGTYTLAKGAANFSAMISVGTATEEFGIAIVNGSPLSHGDFTYTLALTDSTLTLLVEGGEIPPAPGSGGAVKTYSGGTLVSSADFMTGKTLAGNGAENLMHVSSGGKAVGTTVNSGGRMYVSSGGRVAGPLTIASGATVSAYTGSFIDFDISTLAPENTALVNDFSLLKGSPSFLLTVSANQTAGTYILASRASNFTGTISVGTVTETYGNITVDGAALYVSETSYSLKLTADSLILTVGSAGITVSADITELTNQNVTVTAFFAEAMVQRQYSLDGKNWRNYSSPVVMTENGTVYFRFIDGKGTASEAVGYTVANIDRIAPILTVTGNPERWANRDVTLTAVCDEDARIEYSFDNANWTAGSTVTVAENKTVYFRAADAAGNVSLETVVVDKIDKIPPVVPATSVENISPDSAVVTATFSEDSVRREYSLDGKTWLDYAGGVALSSNGTVYFRGIDAAGNISDVSSHTVGSITKGAVVLCSSNSGLTEVISAANVMSGKTVDAAVNLMRVTSGGLATDTAVGSGGRIYVENGGTARVVSVNSGGRIFISSGGTAREVSVNSGGRMFVSSGGTAVGATVAFRGSMHVSRGGTAVDASVSSGGKMYVSSGGKVTGRLDLVSGAVVSAYSGSIVDFDISTIAPGNAAPVTDLSRVRGTPDFTVTVASAQAEGLYQLASGAADFDQIVIIVNADTGKDLCSVSVGDTVTLTGQDYTLNLSDALLTLAVSGTPVPPIVSGLPWDLNGDGRADVIMSITQSGHGAEGATGAWLLQNDQTAAWGNLSQRNKGWEIFGTGITSAGKATNDVYVKSTGNVIGAWVTNDSGNVTGWETVGEFDGNTQILGLGDFNGDGQTDLLLRNTNGAVGCYFTSGPVTGWNYFQSLGDEWKLSAVGDLNGDGRDDVVLKHDAGFAGSWLTQSDGTMVWANLDTLPEGFAVIGAGDFDGDGVDDVLLKKGSYYGAWLVEAGSVKSWFGLGDLGDVTVEQIADFDGDGKDDLRIRTSAGDLGAQLVRAADTLEWRYYGSVGAEWSTRLAAI